jgi:hypothetical protein
MDRIAVGAEDHADRFGLAPLDHEVGQVHLRFELAGVRRGRREAPPPGSRISRSRSDRECKACRPMPYDPVLMISECGDYEFVRQPDGSAVITIKAEKRFASLWLTKLNELYATEDEINESARD